MKIKHFSGYGCVIATKINNTKITENTKRLTIKVTGNHERGLYRNNYYDIYYWLVKRFCKDCAGYNYIYHINIYSYSEKINGLDTDVCVYTIDYITEK